MDDLELKDVVKEEAIFGRPRSASVSSTNSDDSQAAANGATDPLLKHADSTRACLPLPPKRWYFRPLRHFRYIILSTYRRLFSVVFVINVVLLGLQLGRRGRNHRWSAPLLTDVSNTAAANVMIAVLIRQDYIINTIFRIAWRMPFAAPLAIRRTLANVYEYGGIHSGAGISAVLWFSLLSGLLGKEMWGLRIRDYRIKICTFSLLPILWIMAITAFPTVRRRMHNMFEHVHRWFGWFSLALFWWELYLLSNQIAHQTGPMSPGANLKTLPATWYLAVATVHIVLPWLRLRRLQVQPEYLSSHATRLHISERVKNCVVYRISESPLGEYHAFACISEKNGVGGSLIISNAGDWTRKAIDSPRKYYWTRGVPTVGVLCMAQIFRKVVIVTTGSGIGPCLGTIMGIQGRTSCRILWSASGPRRTFGDEICDDVTSVDSKAIIIDTKVEGRPDLVRLAYELYVDSGAEAVFCVSNRNLTRKVIYAMESRGIPAYGPIWDS
ncbi:hypothetical protein BP5796_11277 [Coleophoma crateriformis]|uniref:Integral membrane protein TmpA n=1 Tax=Coleophoma crateriformis TaxID=565419 RepID=A0A3D8QHV2_9HELO|nr:hypothetical protein BP5796_11277 [Coleophoma crateriformis]